jgi:hypothetical protein
MTLPSDPIIGADVLAVPFSSVELHLMFPAASYTRSAVGYCEVRLKVHATMVLFEEQPRPDNDPATVVSRQYWLTGGVGELRPTMSAIWGSQCAMEHPLGLSIAVGGGAAACSVPGVAIQATEMSSANTRGSPMRPK